MIDDFVSEVQPGAALVPAPQHSATALTTPVNERARAIARGDTMRNLFESALDTLDTLGDTIAGAVGLR